MILYLCDEHQDYSADTLADGFFTIHPETVVDWPPKPSLHHGERKVFDCDFAWAEHHWTETQVTVALRDRAFDLIVVPTLRGRVPGWLAQWATTGLLERNADRIVCVDGEDDILNRIPLFTQVLGFEPAVVFKRELPVGETWARPLPFGYPERRIVPPGAPRDHALLYAVEIWPWAVGGLRERLGRLLEMQNLGATIRMTYGGQRRWTPADYHVHLARTRVTIAPAGQGYFTNRLFETLAAGCAVIAEAPTVQFPGELVADMEWLTFRNEFEAIDHIEALVGDQEAIRDLAHAGQAALMDRHTTRRRAETVWGSVYA